MKKQGKREQEFLQEGISINEYTEMPIYNEKDSIKEVEKIRANDRKQGFSFGQVLLFNGEQLALCFPNKKDNAGNVLTETDEFGNKFPIKDTDKKPYFVFARYHNGKKARAQISINDFIDMLEEAESKQADKEKRAFISDLLNTVFPYSVVDFGSFTEQGERELNAERVKYLYDKRLIYRAFPLLNEKQEPIIFPFDWLDKDGVHHLDIGAYATNAQTGGQFGILL